MRAINGDSDRENWARESHPVSGVPKGDTPDGQTLRLRPSGIPERSVRFALRGGQGCPRLVFGALASPKVQAGKQLFRPADTPPQPGSFSIRPTGQKPVVDRNPFV